MGFQTTGVVALFRGRRVEEARSAARRSWRYDEGAMIEPLAVTVHAVHRAGDAEGLNIAVLGAGPIGILVCAVGPRRSARTPSRSPTSAIYRLEKAKECGVNFTW